jgi:hypothetical protein
MGFTDSANHSLKYNRSQQRKGRVFFYTKTTGEKGGELKMNEPSLQLSQRAKKRVRERIHANLRKELALLLVIVLVALVLFKVLFF